MDQDVAELASAAAVTMVKLLVTDGWETAKNALLSLWRRARPDHADLVEADLVQVHADLLATGQHETEPLRQAIAAEWQGRLARLLAGDPALVTELRRLVEDQLRPALAAQDPEGARTVTMHARAEGGGSVFQAGRDQHITGQG
jgi:hypothetical protein